MTSADQSHSVVHRLSLYGHFGPRTLRPQDTSAPIFGAEVSRTEDTLAPVPKCLKTLREGAAGQQQANRTQTCPCGPTCSGPCPTASPHYASCAAFVGRRHKRYYCRWSSRWCCRAWTMATRSSPVYQATRSTDYTVCDERRCTTCLLCAEVRAHHPATP